MQQKDDILFDPVNFDGAWHRNKNSSLRNKVKNISIDDPMTFRWREILLWDWNMHENLMKRFTPERSLTFKCETNRGSSKIAREVGKSDIIEYLTIVIKSIDFWINLKNDILTREFISYDRMTNIKNFSYRKIFKIIDFQYESKFTNFEEVRKWFSEILFRLIFVVKFLSYLYIYILYECIIKSFDFFTVILFIVFCHVRVVYSDWSILYHSFAWIRYI